MSVKSVIYEPHKKNRPYRAVSIAGNRTYIVPVNSHEEGERVLGWRPDFDKRQATPPARQKQHMNA